MGDGGEGPKKNDKKLPVYIYAEADYEFLLTSSGGEFYKYCN
jgi:hypothetical protein